MDDLWYKIGSVSDPDCKATISRRNNYLYYFQ